MLPCVEPQQDEPVAEVALLHVEGVSVHDHQDGTVDGVALHLRAEAEGLPVGARDLAQVLVRTPDLPGAEFEDATVLCSLRFRGGTSLNFHSVVACCSKVLVFSHHASPDPCNQCWIFVAKPNMRENNT